MGRKSKYQANVDNGITVLPPEGTVAGDLAAMESPIRTALRDAESARAMWQAFQPTVQQLIAVVQEVITKAIEEKAFDVESAPEMLKSVSTTSRNFATTVGLMTVAFKQLVEVQSALGGASVRRKALEQMTEDQLRSIVQTVVKEQHLLAEQVHESHV